MKRAGLILALDVDNFTKAKYFVDKLYPRIKIFKVGLQIFTAAGPKIIDYIRKKGADVFLDLKYHDIPNTVKNAVAAAAGLKVKMLTVHTSGGKDMLTAATGLANRPKIIGVTVLTSKSEINTEDKVLELARLAKQSGLDGVVCSGQEAALVKKECGKDFIVITPGIRPQAAAKHDQVRTASAKEAIKAGADYLVVGRPVLEAKDPLSVVEEIWQTILKH